MRSIHRPVVPAVLVAAVVGATLVLTGCGGSGGGGFPGGGGGEAGEEVAAEAARNRLWRSTRCPTAPTS